MRNRTRISSLDAFGLRDQRDRIYPALEASDGSTLSLDFTSMGGALDSRFTFSRSSTATFINSSGLVQYADANLMTFSEDQGNNTTWSAFGTSVTRTTAQSDPLGGSSAIRLSFDATSSDAVISRTVSVNNGLPYVISMWMRSDSGTVTNVRFGRSDAAAGAIFPTLTTTWQRVELSFTASSTSSGIEIRVLNSGSPKTATIHVFGAQLEPGSVMRSYQPATGGTAYHAPRFDHDPATLAPRGLLIEGTATNLINWSEAFDTSGATVNWNWSALNVTRGTVSTSDPTGATSTVVKIQETTGTGIHAPLIITPPASISTTYTTSVFAKAIERTYVQLFENGGSGANTMVNLSNGTVVSESTAGITTVTAIGTTGWYRIAMRLTTGGAQTTINIQYRLSTNGSTTSYAGTTGNGIYIWGAQLEQSAGATSYIPTGSSTVQRAADLCSISGSAFASFYGAPTGWTVAVRATPQSRAAGQFPTFLAVRSAADSGVRIYYYNDGPYNTAYRFGTASTQADVYGPNSLTYGVSRWFGASVTSGAQIASSAGVQVGSTQTLAVPMDQTVMGIGNDAAASPSNHARVHIQTIKFWPRAFSVAELNAVTT